MAYFKKGSRLSLAKVYMT